jgi:hypothetical protein
MANDAQEMQVAGPSVRFSLRLSAELERAVQSEADRESRDRNNMIQVLLTEALRSRRAVRATAAAPDNSTRT